MRQDIYVKMAEVEDSHWWFRSRTKIVESFIKRLHKNTILILDLGCGSGKNFKMLSQYGAVVGFEPEKYAVEVAKSRGIAKTILEGFMPQDEDKIQGQFDLIVLTDVLEHIKEDEDTLLVINRKLNPHGTMLLTVPALKSLWSHHDETHFHFRRYTKSELKSKIEVAGFKIHYISYYNFFLFPVIATIRFIKNHIKSLRDSDDVSQKSPPIIDRILGWIFSSERFLMPFVKFPIGVSLIVEAEKMND